MPRLLTLVSGVVQEVDVVWVEAEIDFGLWSDSAEFTITDAACSPTSKVVAVQSGNPATGRSNGDALWDSITYACRPETGQFILEALPSGPVEGKRKVLYHIS